MSIQYHVEIFRRLLIDPVFVSSGNSVLEYPFSPPIDEFPHLFSKESEILVRVLRQTASIRKILDINPDLCHVRLNLFSHGIEMEFPNSLWIVNVSIKDIDQNLHVSPQVHHGFPVCFGFAIKEVLIFAKVVVNEHLF